MKSELFSCSECEHEFEESKANVLIRSMSFNQGEDAIQATSLVYCPDCGSVVLAIFDSLTCSTIQ